MSLPPQQFCVRWNSYHTNLQTVFPKLLTTENFVDVTLACENRQIKCHKVVLSACSTYFERLLIQNPCKHPIIFMKDMRFSEMQSLVDFMYKGEVNVSQDDLPSLLKSAEALQIRGLCGTENSNSNQDSPTPAPASHNAPPPSSCNASVNTSPKHQQDAFNNHNNSKSCLQPQSPNPYSNQSTSPSSQRSEKRKRDESPDNCKLKQETVEEDGLYYGDMECGQQDEDDLLQTGNVSTQVSEYPMANVMCEYDTSRSPSPSTTPVTTSDANNEDHNYNGQNLPSVDSCEPPAFIIKQDDPHAILTPSTTHLNQQLLIISQKLLAASNNSQQQSTSSNQSNSSNNSSSSQNANSQQNNFGFGTDLGNTKRIRRSEVLLKQAADCVSRGQTFQTVSDQFNIPISTIRFFMARKGILPRRKRGRSSAAMSSHLSPQGRSSGSPASPTQPPYHMATYKLPDFDLGRVS